MMENLLKMPKALEKELRAKAKRLFPGDKERQNRYIYGTLRSTGWKPKKEKS